MSLVEKIKNIMGLPEENDDEMELITNEGNSNFQSLPSNVRENKVLNINTTTQLQVILVKPERYEDAGAIADNLNSKHTVVLNLEDTSRDISRRLLDFLSGVAYANGGQIKRVANGTYIITPYNVDIMGNLLDELEENDVFFN